MDNEDNTSVEFVFRAEQGVNIEIFLVEGEDKVLVARGTGEGEIKVVELTPDQSLTETGVYFILRATDLAGNEMALEFYKE